MQNIQDLIQGRLFETKKKSPNCLFTEQVERCMKILGEKNFGKMCGRLSRAGITGKQAYLLFDLINESIREPIDGNIGLTINVKLKKRREKIKSLDK